MTITKNVWKAAALLLILSLITAVMISGTYAKYTSEFSGEDTALVAKWDIVATGDGGITTSTGGAINLDLFSHEYDTHMTQLDGTDYIIAPGVAGDFSLQFNNNSDVDAQVTFQIAETATSVDVPIVYSFTSPAGVTYDAAGLAAALGTVNVTKGAIATKTVYWSWPYFVSDVLDDADTDLGTASAAGASRSEYGLNVTAAAIQAVPATE